MLDLYVELLLKYFKICQNIAPSAIYPKNTRVISSVPLKHLSYPEQVSFQPKLFRLLVKSISYLAVYQRVSATEKLVIATSFPLYMLPQSRVENRCKRFENAARKKQLRLSIFNNCTIGTFNTIQKELQSLFSKLLQYTVEVVGVYLKKNLMLN